MPKSADTKASGCMLLILFGLIAVFFLLRIMSGGIGLGYSEGDRFGTVAKISKKGFIWKSWEGQLLVGGVDQGKNGTLVPAVWEFSLPARETELAEKIEAAAQSGKRVRIHYRQWLISPVDVDTSYRVITVEVEGEQPVKP